MKQNGRVVRPSLQIKYGQLIIGDVAITSVHARLLLISTQPCVHWKPIKGSLTPNGKTNKRDAQPGVCFCVHYFSMQNAKHPPPHLSSYIVSRVLPWWCIPGQGLAVIHTDPGWWPLTFRPWPGSKGQRWPEGNKSTSMIGILTCSLPPSSAALTSLPGLHLSFAFVTESEDHRVRGGGGVDHTVLHCTLSGNRAHSNARLNIVSFAFNAPARSSFLHFSFVLMAIIKCNL